MTQRCGTAALEPCEFLQEYSLLLSMTQRARSAMVIWTHSVNIVDVSGRARLRHCASQIMLNGYGVGRYEVQA